MSRAISCEGVSKMFRLHTHHKLLAQHFKALFLNDPHNEFHALDKVSFHVDEGDSVAIIGSNGAGKSTLLSVVAGLAEPDEGQVTVKGRIAALMELGSGFHPDLSGMENIFLNSAILGFTKRQTEAMVDKIIDFAGLKEFIDEPLRTYSSGMNMRLAFSIAVHVDPDVLIIDEVLAVGDQDFQKKSFDRIRQFRRDGKTFLCVSHARGFVIELCNKALWLDHGRVVRFGDITEVFAAYEAARHS